MDYEKDLEIDSEALDIEFLNQASLFMRYAKHSANMRKLVDEAKQNLDIVKAKTDSDIRKRPKAYGLEKVTDKAIDAAILIHRGYQRANQYFLNAKYEADMASSAVQAMNIRKESLENLAKLHGQSYFAGPRVPHDLKALQDSRQKKVDAGIASKLTRTK